ncbi:hypothetical protein AAEX28_10185 [Lentisphaerota bacterium WC36G]|nr:hypothetical protein LJT99_13025 [Lentisphaerae bacterium WC36]
MKALKQLLLLGICCISFNVFAVSRITETEMKVQFTAAPNYKIVNGFNVTSTYNKWLVINLSYKMPKQTSKIKSKPYAFIDNPYIKWEILTYLLVGNKPTLGVVTGRTNYWSIAVDGKVHKALAVVPPIIMQRYFVYEGKNVLAALNKTIFIRATLYNSEGKSLAVWYSSNEGMRKSAKKTNTKAVFNKIDNNEDAAKIKGGIYPKNRSAWSFINIQEYDLIKEEEVQ